MASNTDKPAATAAAPPQQQQNQQQPETLLYFAFGSNLSSTQMRSRCPGAAAVGLAFLPGFDFIINERGFANVVPSKITSAASSTSATAPGGGSGVYGVLYRLSSPEEKRRLDRCEGVPWAYEDLVLDVQQLSGGGVPAHEATGESSSTVMVQALVYVDRARVSPSAPRAEYVVRMNAGIREAGAEWGLRAGYVRDVMRRYIPADDDAAADGDGGETAGGLG
ncbi:hypothetical protein INS49_006174 [Diaporthe citri]|uniref:uncharacterized protein n=1 Tax=Diaporthe citri TaxID=83186 RepID=UPI001C7EECFB|nr:uncharacterized protein INS49_006174 [Diaporthe citri]KAG6364572.1 hypothetical protein INS49_006174 [Diaporthe citri]